MDNPGQNDGGAGYNAIRAMLDEARRLAEHLSAQDRNRLLTMCSDIDRLANQLVDLERRGLGELGHIFIFRTNFCKILKNK